MQQYGEKVNGTFEEISRGIFIKLSVEVQGGFSRKIPGWFCQSFLKVNFGYFFMNFSQEFLNFGEFLKKMWEMFRQLMENFWGNLWSYFWRNFWNSERNDGWISTANVIYFKEIHEICEAWIFAVHSLDLDPFFRFRIQFRQRSPKTYWFFDSTRLVKIY